MLKPFILTLSLLPWIPAILCQVTTDGEYVVLEGEAVIVPCHYQSQYAKSVKYWCRGKMREFCSSLARSDDTRAANPSGDKVSISDDVNQLVFTVTMTNVEESDSGWYMCGVEIGSGWTPDVVSYTHIKVVHGMSVLNSQVSGEEGSSVTVECLYSLRYRESEKKWCRVGNLSSCLLTGSDGSYEDTSVAISDDRTRAFTITLKKLQLGDAGWYWCAAGEQQIAIQVQVTPRPTTTVATTSPLAPSLSAAHLPPPKSISKQSLSHSHILETLLVCSSLMLLVGMVILARKMWRMRKPRYPFLEQDPVLRQVGDEKTRINKYCVCDLQNDAVVFHNRDSQDVHSY